MGGDEDLSWVLERMPHRPPMRLVDEVLQCTPQQATCLCRIGPGHLLLEEGRVSPLVAIELFAQTAVVLMIWRAGPQGAEVRSGMLLGTRGIDLEVDALREGDELVVTATEVWHTGPLAQLDCSMRRGGQVVARGTVNVGSDRAASTRV